MSEIDDPAVTLDAKLHRFVDGLTPDEVQVFNQLLEAWSEAGGGAEVEGFSAVDDAQQAMRKLQQMMSMLTSLQQMQYETNKQIIQNTRV